MHRAIVQVQTRSLEPEHDRSAPDGSAHPDQLAELAARRRAELCTSCPWLSPDDWLTTSIDQLLFALRRSWHLDDLATALGRSARDHGLPLHEAVTAAVAFGPEPRPDRDDDVTLLVTLLVALYSEDHDAIEALADALELSPPRARHRRAS